jgi:hypothetical protein
MSTRNFLAVLSVLLNGALICSFAQDANAGGCWWHDRDCYTLEQGPLIHRTFKRRIQVVQGVYEVARKPALYGWTVPADATAKGASYSDGYGDVSRRVLLRPYRNIAIYHRAKNVYVTERVAIQPEAVGEWSLWDDIWLR